MIPKLADKVAIVTGGASGIGLAIAAALVRRGASVAIADIDAGAAEDAAKELSRDGGVAMGLSLDVADRSAWESCAEEVEARFGAVHILCNNAGVGTGRRRAEEVPPTDWAWIHAINVGGMFNGVQCLLRRMEAHGEGGHIVNTGSILGHIATPGQSAYVATKYAVTGFTEALRMELQGRSIGVSLLCPGLVRTALAGNSLARRPSAQAGVAQPPLAAGAVQPIGMDPGAIGEQVADAIQDGRFYIFPHPEYRAVLERRAGEILAACGEPAEPGYVEDIRFLASGYPALFDSADRTDISGRD